MFFLRISTSVLVFYVARLALAERNDGVKLAIGPTCKALSITGATGDANAGLPDLRKFKTIVSFGDSYTSGGKRDGSPQPPAIVIPTDPHAGGRTSNGPVWIEDIANDIGATFKDYAVASSVTSLKVWPTAEVDFLSQLDIFLGQNNSLNADTTLYTIYLGINDWNTSHDVDNGPALLLEAAQVILDKIKLLSRPPTNARSFLITDSYGMGRSDAQGDAYKKKVFNGLASLRAANPKLKLGYVDFAYIWSGVLGPTPGYQAFGYNSSSYCIPDYTTTVGACSDPDHTFYWFQNHPSKQTHRIMADYVKLALSTCH